MSVCVLQRRNRRHLQIVEEHVSQNNEKRRAALFILQNAAALCQPKKIQIARNGSERLLAGFGGREPDALRRGNRQWTEAHSQTVKLISGREFEDHSPTHWRTTRRVSSQTLGSRPGPPKINGSSALSCPSYESKCALLFPTSLFLSITFGWVAPVPLPLISPNSVRDTRTP